MSNSNPLTENDDRLVVSLLQHHYAGNVDDDDNDQNTVHGVSTCKIQVFLPMTDQQTDVQFDTQAN